MKKTLILVTAFSALIAMTGCEPKRGSDAWCKKMDEIPKGKWTLEDAGDYTKYCVLNQKPDEQ
ncbi:DUF3012 domain-containing protein [Microbulbifer flavimaris]|uniref:DUF3012 domain-containing protein n=1 Tax=Microbulbifer flavimaris TaxID=1781068 RepID=A0ABX4I4Q8_9GAMM|nr:MULTISPECIES: DUF3012 domain-containing protein [Microbulbifer]KUJ84940.1 hypothetical protein AVO43_04740 [Microbulbifer sp. ZGT114]PCO07043.1 DUF3012 domain-containing protein [Microbulbifer flavimaris]